MSSAGHELGGPLADPVMGWPFAGHGMDIGWDFHMLGWQWDELAFALHGQGWPCSGLAMRWCGNGLFWA
jgi:hypothetical protein